MQFPCFTDALSVICLVPIRSLGVGGGRGGKDMNNALRPETESAVPECPGPGCPGVARGAGPGGGGGAPGCGRGRRGGGGVGVGVGVGVYCLSHGFSRSSAQGTLNLQDSSLLVGTK